MRSARLTVATAVLAVAAGPLVPVAAGAASDLDRQAAPAPYRVTIKASVAEAVARQDKVVLTGAVYPTPPEGSQVLVQAKYEGDSGWRKAGNAAVKKNGTYRFVDKPKTTRDRAYRVVKRGDDVGAEDKSRERAVHVLGWTWLTSLTPSATENVYKTATMPINGDDYSHTLFVDRTFPSGFTEFTLGRKCTTLEATVGLSDRTETGGRATISLTEDGVATYARTFDLGASDALSVDVTDVYRMRFDFAQVPQTPVTEPSVGAGRVLCD